MKMIAHSLTQKLNNPEILYPADIRQCANECQHSDSAPCKPELMIPSWRNWRPFRTPAFQEKELSGSWIGNMRSVRVPLWMFTGNKPRFTVWCLCPFRWEMGSRSVTPPRLHRPEWDSEQRSIWGLEGNPSSVFCMYMSKISCPLHNQEAKIKQ